MRSWIEQAGGPASAAATMAPVIRALFGGKDQGKELLQVSFAIQPKDGADGPVVWLDAAAAGEGPEAVYAALLPIAARSPRPAAIHVADLGWFTLNAYERRPEKRLDRCICLVTGAAQGLGEGIARELGAAGASLVIADLNLPLAETVARSISAANGQDAIALLADVGQEDSIRQMVEQTVLRFGGLDLLVSSAGILEAGSLEEMSLQAFERLTRINYTAFFLAVKYGARPMKLQARFDAAYSADIVQINSKSGLEGSCRNFAYAGSKFGGIGLVQSFAKELVEYRIKVNAI
jgi:NAD(P)-dependent dehydrogenase (short-subunit alcohol dehydrogenase family)